MKGFVTKFSALLFAVIIFGFIPSVHAIEYGGVGGKPAFPDPNNDRTKSIFIYTLDPGRSKKDGILLVNNTKETKTLLVYATDSQRSSDGSFACEQLSDTKDSVGSWITLEKSEVTLKSGTNEIVNFTITAPDAPEIGEHNGCIMIQEKQASTEKQGGLSLSFRTGVRVAVTIPGEKIRTLEISNFVATTNEKDKIIKNTVSVTNKGNVSIDAAIISDLIPLFGEKVNVVNNTYPILRGDTATYNFEIPYTFWGGFYKVSSKVSYDKSAEAVIGKDTSNPKTIIEQTSGYVFLTPTRRALAIYTGIILFILTLITTIISYLLFRRRVAKTWQLIAVTKEDDIQTLAQKYKISWRLLTFVNKIKPPYRLKDAMKIKVPPTKKSAHKITSKVS